MNNTVKNLILTLNVILLIIALCWAYKVRDFEPVLAAGGFFVNCIALQWGDAVYEKVAVRNVRNNSNVQIDQPNEGSIKVENIDQSDINIKK